MFNTSKQNISLHVCHYYEEGELEQSGTVKDSLTVQNEGTHKVKRTVRYDNLDVIISVGYRVKSLRGTQFRKWADQVTTGSDTRYHKWEGIAVG